MIELRDATKSFGNQRVLQPTNLVVAPGKTTVLLGPSGCGKSTILRMIVGLIQPDRGTVLFDGQPLLPENLRQTRHHIGYMIQDGGLFPHLSVRGNVSLMAMRLGWTSARVNERLYELADLTHLARDLIDRFPTQLSGGQRQRVALMRALFLDPEVLLLDEPMGALDPLIRAELQQELRTIFRRLDKTVLLVTHDIGEASFLGDQIFLLKDGQIVQRGTMEELVRTPADPFVSEFIHAQRLGFEEANTRS